MIRVATDRPRPHASTRAAGVFAQARNDEQCRIDHRAEQLGVGQDGPPAACPMITPLERGGRFPQ